MRLPDGGMYICSDPNYEFASLSANARSHTRRGLARCTVEQMDFKDLAVQAYPLITETNLRQTGKQPHRNESQWKSFCDLAGRWPGLEAWGAFVDGELAAFIVAMLAEDCYYIHLQKSASALLKHYSNNALLFTVMKTALARPEVGFVANGQIALAAKEGLFHFKTSMGFEIHPFKEQMVFNPLIKPGLWAGKAVTSRLTKSQSGKSILAQGFEGTGAGWRLRPHSGYSWLNRPANAALALDGENVLAGSSSRR